MKRFFRVVAVAITLFTLARQSDARDGQEQIQVAIYVVPTPDMFAGQTESGLAAYLRSLTASSSADTNVVVVARSADCWTRMMANSTVGRWRLASDAAEVILQASRFPTFQNPSEVIAAVERHFLASYAGDVGFAVWTASDGGGSFKTFAIHPAADNAKSGEDVDQAPFTTENQSFPFASKSNALDIFLKLILMIVMVLAVIMIARHRRKTADKRLQKYLDDRNEVIRQKRRATSVFMNTLAALILLPVLAGIAWCQQQVAFVDFSGSFTKYRPLVVREIAASLRNGPVILFSIGDSTVFVDTLKDEMDLRKIMTYPVESHTHLTEAFLTMERVADSVAHSGKHPIISLYTDGLPDDAGNQELGLLVGADTAGQPQNLFNSGSVGRNNNGMLEWWALAGTIFCFIMAMFLLMKYRRSKSKHLHHLPIAGETRVRLVTKNKSPMSFEVDDLLAHRLSIGSSVDSDVRLFNTGNYQLLAEKNQNQGINIVFGSLDGKDGFKLIVENIAAHK